MFLLQSKPGLEGCQGGVARPREGGGALQKRYLGHAIPGGDQAKMPASTHGKSTSEKPDECGEAGARFLRASETHIPSLSMSFREEEKHIPHETTVTAHSGKMDGVLTPASWPPERRGEQPEGELLPSCYRKQDTSIPSSQTQHLRTPRSKEHEAGISPHLLDQSCSLVGALQNLLLSCTPLPPPC